MQRSSCTQDTADLRLSLMPAQSDRTLRQRAREPGTIISVMPRRSCQKIDQRNQAVAASATDRNPRASISNSRILYF